MSTLTLPKKPRDRRAWRRPKLKVSPATLRAERVAELGRLHKTSTLYVRTLGPPQGKLYLFHTDDLVDRALDEYAITLAVNWIESGITSAEVASNLSVGEPTLRNALLAAGYERLSASQVEQRRNARSARRPGNRRGRLVSRRATSLGTPTNSRTGEEDLGTT